MERAVLGIFAAFAALSLLALLASANSASPVNATTSVGTPVTLPVEPATLATVTGAPTNITLDINSTTLHWQGFYGNVTGSIALGYGSSKLKTWDLGPKSGQVYISTSANINFSQINSTDVLLNDVDSAFTFLSGADDSANLTGVEDSNSQINISNYVLAANSRPVIYSRDKSGSASWQQIVLAHTTPSGKDTFVFGGIIREGAQAFNGQAADFQIVVPTSGILNTTGESYYFYGEVR